MVVSTHRKIMKLLLICLVSLGTLSGISVSGQVSAGEKAALLALYGATDGAHWTNNTNWGVTSDPSNWYGVTVEDNKVVKLQLRNNNLTGPIPDAFYDLPHLRVLHLRDNELSGSISSLIGNLTSLTFLALNENQFSGTLPSTFGALTQLKEIWIQENNFEGAVPDEFADITDLQFLCLNDNAFTHLPDLSALTNLVELYVKNNKLDFGDLEPNVGVASSKFQYAPQAVLGTASTVNTTTGSTESLTFAVDGASNTYRWYKNNILITLANTNPYSLSITDATVAGNYTLRVFNTSLPDLTLVSAPITVVVSNGPAIPDWYITTQSGKNVIVVDEPEAATPAVETGYVYVEKFNGSAFAYDLITPTTLDFTVAGPFEQIDNGSNASTQVFKYKIKVKDASDTYSGFSDVQKSIHLTINEGLSSTRNLLWTSYEGKSVDYYEVWASYNNDLGTTGTTGVSLATLPNSSNSFTDISGAGYGYYMIMAHFPASPEPLKSGLAKFSQSNVFSVEQGFTNLIIPRLQIYPNPVSDVATLEFDNAANSEYQLRVLDLTGKVVRKEDHITGTEYTFNRGELKEGIYIVQLLGERTINARMVIR